ncbi:MAG: N-acetylmuramoyl-L-alanine amidase [Candidatus Dormibacteraeota bacterium]|nr:N-acetylmuramoyl-L-alanine amidase [Candidatus Dormibacteraeota bacterium]
MRLRAFLFYILAIAPAALLTAGQFGATVTAKAAGSSEPQAIVVAIDAGHGGSTNPSNPTQPFDPGAIGVNGVLEKDVTLDVAQRLAALLSDDLVAPVLTRNGDQWMDIASREQVATDHHAAVFVSIHCNSFTDPGPSGSLVLYPNDMGQPLAQSLSDALGRDLASSSVPDDGIVLRDNWWNHAPMPTSTVEMAYLSNPHEAGLMATESFRQQVAVSIRDGIEHFDRDIATRKSQILAWRRDHLTTPAPTPRPASSRQGAAVRTGSSSSWAALLLWLLVIGVTASLVRWRHAVLRVANAMFDEAGFTSPVQALTHASRRRRRQRLRIGALSRVAHAVPRSVYDELGF